MARQRLTLHQQAEAARVTADGGGTWKIAKYIDNGGAFIHVTRSCQTDVYFLPSLPFALASFRRTL